MRLMVVGILILLASPVWSADLTITLSDQEQASWLQLQGGFRQCLGSIALGDSALCKALDDLLRTTAEKIRQAKMAQEAPK